MMKKQDLLPLKIMIIMKISVPLDYDILKLAFLRAKRAF